ncbi:MAG: hypothetical protein II711_02400, partial [Clostridia bacterium]|nr:hypothetical protein [Clostridia bacterium]
KSFRVSHSLRFRSDAQWNLRGHDPLVVKGDWYWDATFEQSFTAVMVPIFVGVTIYALAFYFAYPYLPESIAPDDEETEN